MPTNPEAPAAERVRRVHLAASPLGLASAPAAPKAKASEEVVFARFDVDVTARFFRIRQVP